MSRTSSASRASGAPGAATDLGLGTVLVAAQTKVLSTLPPELRSRADRVRERFLLDAPELFKVLRGFIEGSADRRGLKR